MEQISITNTDSDGDQLSLDPTSIPDFEDDGKGSEEPLNNEPEYGLEPSKDDHGGWGELPGYYKDDGGGLEEPLYEPYEDDGRRLDEDDGRGLEELESYGYDDESYEGDGKGWEEPEPYEYDGEEPEIYGGLEEPEPYRYDDRGWGEPLHEPVYPPEQFDQDYLCLPISHIDKHYLEDGNKVIMPASALGRLMDMNINEYPMQFEINNYGTDRNSHCGVLEFSAEEGFVHLPNWMMKNMKFQEGDLVSLKNVFGLPKGEYMKIQPHEMKFVMNLKNPKEVLESALKNFTCVTSGDTIMIYHEGQKYYVDIVETKPSNAISLFETDCEVDFAPHLDYKEPKRKPTSVIKKEIVAEVRVEEKEKFNAFTGVGWRLDGEVLPTNDERCNSSSNSEGKKFQTFTGKKGYLEVKKSSDVDVEGKKFQAFRGKKYTLGDKGKS